MCREGVFCTLSELGGGGAPAPAAAAPAPAFAAAPASAPMAAASPATSYTVGQKVPKGLESSDLSFEPGFTIAIPMYSSLHTPEPRNPQKVSKRQSGVGLRNFPKFRKCFRNFRKLNYF